MIEPRRIAVIGAGIVGVSCALHLQRDGHAVTLIDQRAPGTGTSSTGRQSTLMPRLERSWAISRALR